MLPRAEGWHGRAGTRFALAWSVVISALLGWSPGAFAQNASAAAMLDATKAGDVARVRALLALHVDVNATEADGTTALHWATHIDNLDLMRLLLRAGARPNQLNRYRVMPLALAAENGSAGGIGELLRAGASVDTALPNGETALMIAARSGHADAVRVLLDAGADPNHRELIRGQNALMWAAAEKHPDVVQLLIDYGADIYQRSTVEDVPKPAQPSAAGRIDPSGGLTPLMFAVRAGDLDTTRVLLYAGADMAETTPDGTGILVLAILNARYELAAYLLTQGADPNAADLRGSPLQVLAWERRANNHGLATVLPRVASGTLDSLTLAEDLLQYGADPNVRIEWNEPPSNPERSRRARLPKDLALGPTELSFEGATAFWIAARYADGPMMRLLYDYGADPMLATRQNVTPLMAAAGFCYWEGEGGGSEKEALEAVKLAYELGNRVDEEAEFGDFRAGDTRWNHGTALHGAVSRPAPSIVDFLIEKGAALDVRTEAGWTPLNIAEGQYIGETEKAHPDIAAHLRQLMIARGLPVAEPAGVSNAARDLK